MVWELFFCHSMNAGSVMGGYHEVVGRLKPYHRVFVNTRLLVHKHVKISVDEWILETTHPQKHVKYLEQYIP